MPGQGQGRTERARRQEFKLLLPENAALAVLKCFEVEGARTAGPRSHLQVFFDLGDQSFAQRATRSPGMHSQVSVLTNSGAENVTVLLEELADGNVQSESLHVPRSQVKFAFGGTGQEVFPRLPVGLMPVVAASFERAVFTHADGWSGMVDRSLAFHPVDRTWLRDASQETLAPPFARSRSTLLTIIPSGPLPAWIKTLVRERAVPYSLFADAARTMATEARTTAAIA